ncbi:hypothetical protein LAZ67_2003364 [Cordylochernes scorpioides]|uniref:Uncharacterized protein n=1 Tax=Cordylochernes scorpioides TaxID=51811 RepID=A0ABY6K2R9_9ARAC|nr:hypothetical protein LAZ67_2003364 [Cordylochernes scorpioides]
MSGTSRLPLSLKPQQQLRQHQQLKSLLPHRHSQTLLGILTVPSCLEAVHLCRLWVQRRVAYPQILELPIPAIPAPGGVRLLRKSPGSSGMDVRPGSREREASVDVLATREQQEAEAGIDVKTERDLGQPTEQR